MPRRFATANGRRTVVACSRVLENSCQLPVPIGCGLSFDEAEPICPKAMAQRRLVWQIRPTIDVWPQTDGTSRILSVRNRPSKTSASKVSLSVP